MDFRVNESKNRFELEVENSIAFIDFILNKDNQIFLTHTEVPQELSGKGVGKALVAQSLEYIKDKGYTLAPLCPFVAGYVKKNPQWGSILASGFSV